MPASAVWPRAPVTPSRPGQTLLHEVEGQLLCVDVVPGDSSRVPLLVFNGIGAPLEVLQPFVDQLDTAWEVIRFDVPGVGRWPTRYSAAPVRLGSRWRVSGSGYRRCMLHHPIGLHAPFWTLAGENMSTLSGFQGPSGLRQSQRRVQLSPVG